ncbi:uncharacterized protein [Montipora capricornis]|uniref:uncharacterized protein n=1 Tax=Montipora capricornis TaxID=246305 RepID=UPI0035F19387
MLQRDRNNTLWKLHDPVPPQVRHKFIRKISLIKWTIPANDERERRSPRFDKWERKWTLLQKEREISLEYTQGVEPVYLSICFLLKTPNSSKVNNIPFVKLTEGKMVKAREATALTIEELTVKMELLEPEIS